MLREFIYPLVFITFITACSPLSPAMDLPATKTPVPVTSPTTTLSPLPSQTPVPTTATPDPAQEILGSEARCVQKRQEKDFTGFANTFLVMGEGGGYDSEYVLLDFQDMKRHNLFEDLPVVTSASVSPDQKHVFAFHCGFKGAFDCANILGEAGKTLKLIQEDSKNEHWQRTRWLDNERVLSWTDLPNTPLVVFNPFTGEESNPPIHFQNTFLYPIQTSAITINSSLKTAIYFTKIGKDRLVMMNLEKKSIVAEIPFSFDDDGMEHWEDSWSPDQNEFLVVSAGEQPTNAQNELYVLKIDELYSLKTDGTLQQLTHFGLLILTTPVH